MTVEEKMKNGKLYVADLSVMGEELTEKFDYCKDLLYEFNYSRPSELEKRTELIKKVFASTGEKFYIEQPLWANWGCNTHIGENFYANFNLTLVDDGEIFIGDNVMIAPNVTIDTATHPICPELRKKDYQYNLPVKIGNNVWIGAGSIILPGVSIGDNSVIGAGSVVTKDVPPDVVAVGAPCRVLRPITQRDRQFYDKNKIIDVPLD